MTDNRSGDVTGGTSFGGTTMTTRLLIRDFGGRNRLDSLNKHVAGGCQKCQIDVNDSNGSSKETVQQNMNPLEYD